MSNHRPSECACLDDEWFECLTMSIVKVCMLLDGEWLVI